MDAIIFANGDLKDPCHKPDLLRADMVIAADGGSRHCLALQITPDVLIGDLDSSDPGLIERWTKEGVEVIHFPADKDQTDLELALLLAQNRGAAQVAVYGAIGGRLDMTFGNLILLAHPQLTIPVTLICGEEEVTVLRPGDSLRLEGSPGDIISLLPLHPDGASVTAQGVRYPLDHEKLAFGLTRGISNQLTGTKSTISLATGLLAVVHTRKTPLTKKEVS